MKQKSSIKYEDQTILNASENDLCQDLDNDCYDVKCKLTCWLHAPELGICPFINESFKTERENKNG